VRLLVDTHVALWFFEDPTLLVDDARTAIEDSDNIAFLSAASIWEWALKRARGKGAMPIEISEAAGRASFVELPVTWSHGGAAASLPRLHGDPFDRMLVAQAGVEGLVLLTRDPLVQQYDVRTMVA
jgi:PIN domain nuclease of toxin-antitoxin system